MNESNQPKRRVVVTGIGTLNPLGLTTDDSWQAAKRGQSGIDRITLFDSGEFDSQIAGEVTGFDPIDFIPKKEVKKMDRFIHLSLAATEMAWEDSQLGDLSDAARARFGALIGVGIGGLPAIENIHKVLDAKGPSKAGPFFIPMIISNMAPGHISIKYGLKGPNFAITSACASGAHAIGESKRYIEYGLADMMIAGGAEACVCPFATAGFAAMKALSKRNDDPQAASRPWDADRDGFVIAEGAATLILEEREHALARGAKIYAEIVGYGASSDAFHMTNPVPGGAGASQAMEMALQDAKVNANAIDYVNAHGTSTGAGDLAEALAVENVFQEHAKKLLVSSTKSMTGHALGAAGAIESVFCIKALQDQVAPPTINLHNPIEESILDFVANEPREQQLSLAMNNSFGFGGTNASLIFARGSD